MALEGGSKNSKFEYSKSESKFLRVKKSRLTAVLRTVRIEADLTQAQMAEKIGQTQSYVSKYESGEQRLDLLELEAICEASRISLVDFVRRYLESR
jgi:transcriptional regulator with XRE-family HTH domain